MRANFPSSGEINFSVDSADASIAAVRAAYGADAEIDEIDGLTLSHAGWRLNVRKSNTEPLVRSNVEALGYAASLSERVREVARVIESA